MATHSGQVSPVLSVLVVPTASTVPPASTTSRCPRSRCPRRAGIVSADLTIPTVGSTLGSTLGTTDTTLASFESGFLSERPFPWPTFGRRASSGRSFNHASPDERDIIDSRIIRAIEGVARRPLEMEPSKARATPEEIKPRKQPLFPRSRRAYLPQIVPIVPEDS